MTGAKVETGKVQAAIAELRSWAIQNGWRVDRFGNCYSTDPKTGDRIRLHFKKWTASLERHTMFTEKERAERKAKGLPRHTSHWNVEESSVVTRVKMGRGKLEFGS